MGRGRGSAPDPAAVVSAGQHLRAGGEPDRHTGGRDPRQPGVPRRGWGLVWLLPMFLVRPSSPAPGEAWVTLLDVGQGLSAVVQTAGHTLVDDNGGGPGAGCLA